MNYSINFLITKIYHKLLANYSNNTLIQED